MPDRPVPESSTSPVRTPARDYYDPRWYESTVADRPFDETDEPWFRTLPLMRAYGFIVIGVALATGYPRDDPDGWRGPLAVAITAALAAAFWIMWVRRPIWAYRTRTLAVHGVFQLTAYAGLVVLSPSFAVLQLIVYPQIVFSLPMRWSVVGGLSVGAFTGIVMVARSTGDPAAALPWLFYNLLIAALVVAMGVWMRLTISQSLERRALVEELTAARAGLATAERDAAVAEERARLAREIHDTLAQGFASVVTHLEAADACLAAEPSRARADIGTAREVARASLAEARTLVWALRPETIAAAGLTAAIERVAASARGTDGPAIDVTVSGSSRALHPDVEITLLRAAQETLANARRHARASQITVTLTYFADEVTLDIADDGEGFDPVGAGLSGGMGLRGMRERAELLGGTVAIESAPGEGTVVAISLPAVALPGAGPMATTTAAPGTRPVETGRTSS